MAPKVKFMSKEEILNQCKKEEGHQCQCKKIPEEKVTKKNDVNILADAFLKLNGSVEKLVSKEKDNLAELIGKAVIQELLFQIYFFEAGDISELEEEKKERVFLVAVEAIKNFKEKNFDIPVLPLFKTPAAVNLDLEKLGDKKPGTSYLKKNKKPKTVKPKKCSQK